jgi:hypothetical protein
MIMTRRQYNITRCNILQKDFQSSHERGKHHLLSHTNTHNTKPVIFIVVAHWNKSRLILKYSLSYLLQEKHENTKVVKDKKIKEQSHDPVRKS